VHWLSTDDHVNKCEIVRGFAKLFRVKQTSEAMRRVSSTAAPRSLASLVAMSRRCLSSTAAPRSLASLVASASPSSLALLAPQQGISWTYAELDRNSRKLAGGLKDLGYRAGGVCISDVPNVAENLLLQLALAHIGASISTPPKDADAMKKLVDAHDVQGVVCVDSAANPVADPQTLPTVELSSGGPRSPGAAVSFAELLEHSPPHAGAPAATEASLLGSFGGAKLSHGAAIELGEDAAARLKLTAADRVCCSVTLMHAFGIGSAVTSALVSGATVVLPAVGGIRGCGNPSQRAEVTVQVLSDVRATVLLGDTHTLKAMPRPPPPELSLSLRAGVIKIGSGSSFLEGVAEAPGTKGAPPTPLEYAGCRFHAMGKKA
jgi:hypothetical protein